MKLTTLAVFSAGYVLGSKAGRERYEQITVLMGKAAQSVEQKSVRDRIMEYANSEMPSSRIFEPGGLGAKARANGSSRTPTGQQPGR